MARPLRIEFEGAVYHIISRGNAKQDIFLNEEDRKAFFSVLAKAVKRFEWLCHAYCFMGNHCHLLLETSQANLSGGMHYLTQLPHLRPDFGLTYVVFGSYPYAAS